MTLKDDLIEARAIIEDEEHWTQRTCARRADGRACVVDSSEAVRWCAGGAILKVTHDIGVHLALGAACPDGEYTVTRVNDILGHRAVLEMFDRAIEAAT